MKRSLRRLLPEAEPRGVSHLRRDEQFRGRRDHPAMDAIRSRPRRMSVTERMCACCSPRGMAVLLAAALLATGPECLGTAAYAESGKGWAGEFSVITTARSAHSLSNEEAQRSLPVHLRGVVTYFDPDFGTGHPAIFIHDGTGGIFVDLSCKATCKAADQLFAGALLDVRGVSAPGSFGPIVGNSQFRLIGRASLPAHPPRVDFATLKTGAEDAQWVEVEGTVHRVIEFPTSVTVCLEMRDGAIKVTIPREVGATYAGLVDAKGRPDDRCASSGAESFCRAGDRTRAQRSLCTPFHPDCGPLAMAATRHAIPPRAFARQCDFTVAGFLTLHTRCVAGNLRGNK